MRLALARCVCLLLSLSLAPRATGATGATIGEAEFKAALVYNVLLFVRWPEGGRAAEAPLRLCYPESETSAAQLSRLAAKTIRQRRLTIRPVRIALDAAAQCDALWISADRADFLASVALLARSYPVLIIAEGRDVAEKGAAIGISFEGGMARLAIGDRLLRHAGIDISARLQQLASRRDHD